MKNVSPRGSAHRKRQEARAEARAEAEKIGESCTYIDMYIDMMDDGRCSRQSSLHWYAEMVSISPAAAAACKQGEVRCLA
jgi:hypothetical protein